MFVILSRTTLILTSRSNSKYKWLKPPVEVAHFTVDEPTSQRRRAFTVPPMTPILLGLCSQDSRLSIWVGGVDHLHRTPLQQPPEIASPTSSQTSGDQNEKFELHSSPPQFINQNLTLFSFCK
ncbi:hypothetical protein ACE6H2_016724 [Prunus campanulata]